MLEPRRDGRCAVDGMTPTRTWMSVNGGDRRIGRLAGVGGGPGAAMGIGARTPRLVRTRVPGRPTSKATCARGSPNRGAGHDVETWSGTSVEDDARADDRRGHLRIRRPGSTCWWPMRASSPWATRRTTTADWDEVMARRAGMFLTCKFAIEAMVPTGGGAIVCLSSISGLAGQKRAGPGLRARSDQASRSSGPTVAPGRSRCGNPATSTSARVSKRSSPASVGLPGLGNDATWRRRRRLGEIAHASGYGLDRGLTEESHAWYRRTRPGGRADRRWCTARRRRGQHQDPGRARHDQAGHGSARRFRPNRSNVAPNCSASSTFASTT